MTADRPETRHEAGAALAARRELGTDYDEAIAASLADRVEQLAAYRVAELRRSDAKDLAEQAENRSARTQGFVLGLVSLGAGIPITAIGAAMVDPGLLGVVVSWAGIVGVNAVFTWRHRRP